jgi:hypothetical protein
MSLTTADVIIIVISTILSFITVLLVIWEAEEQMFVFGLRPSESVSTDIAGLITLSRGLAGDVKLSYSNVTREIIYNITIKDKLVCVTARTHYNVTDCSSFVSEIECDGGPCKVGGSGFDIEIEKTKDSVGVSLGGQEW